MLDKVISNIWNFFSFRDIILPKEVRHHDSTQPDMQ